jgi:hypothetical protein
MENINAVPNATANAEESKTMNPTPIADRIAAVLADLTAMPDVHAQSTGLHADIE